MCYDRSFLGDSTVERFVIEVSLSRDYRLKRKISYSVLPASSCGRGVGYLLIKEFTDESFREVVFVAPQSLSLVRMPQSGLLGY